MGVSKCRIIKGLTYAKFRLDGRESEIERDGNVAEGNVTKKYKVDGEICEKKSI